MKVELLYFEGCPNWLVADERLRQALERAGAGETQVEHVLVSTPEELVEAITSTGRPPAPG